MVKGEDQEVQTVTYCVSLPRPLPCLIRRCSAAGHGTTSILFNQKEVTWKQEAKEYFQSCYIVMSI